MSRRHRTVRARLLALLREEIGLPEGARLVRHYRGHWQRAAGAWCWSVVDQDGCDLGIGSEDSMTACVRYGISVNLHRSFGGDLHVHARTPPID